MCINVDCGNSFGKRATWRATKIRTKRMTKCMAVNDVRQPTSVTMVYYL